MITQTTGFYKTHRRHEILKNNNKVFNFFPPTNTSHKMPKIKIILPFKFTRANI